MLIFLVLIIFFSPFFLVSSVFDPGEPGMDVGFLFLYSNGKKSPFLKFFVKVQCAIESFCENLEIVT